MEITLDLTGRPAGHFGAKLAKRISWQEFAKLTRTDERPDGCPIPGGAILRPVQRRDRPEPRPLPAYWLDGRECRFPMRYTDRTRRWKGWPPRRPWQADLPMADLLRSLSATAQPRHYTTLRVPATAPTPTMRRLPLAEEHSAGRIDARLMAGADWFSRVIEASSTAKAEGVRKRTSTGAMVAVGSRDPLALWPAEAAADQAIRLRSRFRTLGPLARILVRALQGGEIADLAPAWPFSQRRRAEAGRVRLRAALELCARMAEREVDRLPQWEVLQVVQAACAECSKLEATRRMRVPIPANDNIRNRIAA